jgi:uncharacterized cupin superfamily protein
MKFAIFSAAAALLSIVSARPTTASVVKLPRVDSLILEPAPIDPSWILSGNPVAHAKVLSRSADDSALTSVWDCTAGTFRWNFGWDETVIIIEGEVEVTGDDGEVRSIGIGEVGYFPAGTSSTWHVPVYVRKIAVCRRAMPFPFVIALRLAAAVKTALRGGRTG